MVSLRVTGLLLLLASCAAPPFPAPGPDPALQSRLEALVKGFRGDAGIYVRHLPTGREAAIRADEPFPAASLVKVPILCRLFDRLEKGELDYHKPLVYDAKRRYDDEFTGAFKDGAKVSLRQLAFLMIAASDNTASVWCQELAGGGAAINDWLAAGGFEHTRVNSRTPGREEAYKALGWGQTTPREMAGLLVRIRDGKAVSPAASEEMHRLLSRSYWDGEALSSLPPSAAAMSKQGAINRSRSEAVLVHAPSGDYVFCVITKNQQDTSWEGGNEGFVLLRDVSRALWEHFEPGRPWRRAEGAERYW